MNFLYFSHALILVPSLCKTVARFECGFCWFYWPWYKNRQVVEQAPGNTNNYGGYLPKQLYVTKKYDDYKEEILQHFSIKDYQDLIVTKAESYMSSEEVKAMKARGMGVILHFDIGKGVPITMQHIISIILYCDFSKYSTLFSASFRKLYSHETMKSVKNRNQEYWWQSKFFKETVLIYGKRGYDAVYNPKGESGPFCMYSISTIKNVFLLQF